MGQETFTLTARTDANGYFAITETKDPPGPAWIEKSVSLWVTLMQPPDTRVQGTLDIDATDGKPSNQEKNFTARSGKETSLGEWDVSLGETVVVVRGRTTPPARDATLQVRVRAEW